MEDTTIQLTPAALALVPLIAGIIQQLKLLPIIAPARPYMSLVALVLGVALSFATSVANPVTSGLVIGLMAVGGYKVMGAKPESPPTP